MGGTRVWVTRPVCSGVECGRCICEDSCRNNSEEESTEMHFELKCISAKVMELRFEVVEIANGLLLC